MNDCTFSNTESKMTLKDLENEIKKIKKRKVLIIMSKFDEIVALEVDEESVSDILNKKMYEKIWNMPLMKIDYETKNYLKELNKRDGK